MRSGPTWSSTIARWGPGRNSLLQLISVLGPCVACTLQATWRFLPSGEPTGTLAVSCDLIYAVLPGRLSGRMSPATARSVEKLVVCAPHDPRFYSCDDGPMGPMTLPFKGAHEVRPKAQRPRRLRLFTPATAGSIPLPFARLYSRYGPHCGRRRRRDRGRRWPSSRRHGSVPDSANRPSVQAGQASAWAPALLPLSWPPGSPSRLLSRPGEEMAARPP